MKKTKITGRETFLLIFLVILLVGVVYYMGFYTPLQAELASIANQSSALDTEMTTAMAKAANMNRMQQELDEIFARPKNEITQIAPYDNKEVVLNMLYGILARTQDYSLSFTDPAVQDDGTVRRNISMVFSCENYAAAKAVIRDLSASSWRCLVSNCTISGDTDMMQDPVVVNMTITFFESTKLS